MQAFVPKNRRPKFELILRIIDLSNIPLTSGTCYVKWHLPSSTSAEHRGRTDKAIIKDHKAVFDYLKTLEVRLTIDRSSYLQETEIHFEILQEYSVGVRGDRIVLGTIRLNLSEYVGKGDDDDDTSHIGHANESHSVPGITRRYLLQSSKINSTLKLRLAMRQLEGDKNYLAPTLKAPMVFGGIAGILSSEQADPDDAGHMPNISSKTRDMSEMQDIYRRTLAASWRCTASEMAPDRLIEDLFQGGDGGSMMPPPSPFTSRILGQVSRANPSSSQEDEDNDDDTEVSDAGSRRTVRGHKPSHISTHTHSRSLSGLLSPFSAATPSQDRHHRHRRHPSNSNDPSTPKPEPSPTNFGHSRHRTNGHGSTSVKNGSVDTSISASSSSSNLTNLTGVSGRASIEGQVRRHGSSERKSKTRSGKGRPGNEITEFDVREDLRSWNLG